MLLLVFSVTLLAAVLLSARFQRTILSSTVVFLAAGFFCGPRGAGLVSLGIDDPLVPRLSEWALVLILFSDALPLRWSELRHVWQLPGRALLVGLPLTIGGIAVVGHLLIGLAWRDAFLVGAILSPTDPVFASAIVGRAEIPSRLRHLLHLESGLNDGVALPIVIALLALAAGAEWTAGTVLRETIGGIAFGAAVALAGGWLRSLRFFDVSEEAAPVHALAVLLVAYAGTTVLHLNAYLAAFTAGAVFGAVCAPAVGEFEAFGARIAALFKLAAVLIFAVMLSSQEPAPPLRAYLFAVLVLTVVRLVALEVALIGGGMSLPERLTAAWFGPKGFASVVYGLMLLTAKLPNGPQLFYLIALVIVASMVLHSSTDVPVAAYFKRRERAARPSP